MATAQPKPPLNTRRSSTLSFNSPGLSPGGGNASRPNNPLLHKVQRLLSANLEDSGTRAALDTLGEQEDAEEVPKSTGGAANGVGLKGAGTALKRGGLRKEVEEKMAEGSREFLQAFSEVNNVRSFVRLRPPLADLADVSAEIEHAPVTSRRDACVL